MLIPGKLYNATRPIFLLPGTPWNKHYYDDQTRVPPGRVLMCIETFNWHSFIGLLCLYNGKIYWGTWTDLQAMESYLKRIA